MTRTIHRNFTEVTDAESARTALLSKGFPPASVTLTRHKPLPQNGATSTVSHLLDNLTPGGPDAAEHARERSGAMLTIDIYDDDQVEQADAILSSFGARAA
ncbi:MULTISPECIES: hypothetical protein [Duganella]|uniref:Uncharacterized protein n=1 Tax=Duganella zoogloeoides TaxID=75659 RepID=A0ABZ0XVD9_9BURK|nr:MULTISPECIES: hypothetical protein [Duganella]KQN78931.1 hypothetical protein ASF04_00030 [Duganella sp. Leaf61]MPQ59849.1 hypothetical protein [Duganella sp. FT27W]WQH03349.1 hypothetical protein SR858_20170 [Duganella zoogloeoides]